MPESANPASRTAQIASPGIALAKQDRFEDAYQSFMKVAEAEPKNHGALHNASLMKWALGEPKAAAELMAKANAIASTPLSRMMYDKFKAREQQTALDPNQ